MNSYIQNYQQSSDILQLISSRVIY